jgi:hypothetical protein
MLSNIEFLHHLSNFEKMKILNYWVTPPPRLLWSPKENQGRKFPNRIEHGLILACKDDEEA